MNHILIPRVSLRRLLDEKFIVTIYIVAMCIQLVAIEGDGISPLKVLLMAFAPFLFIYKKAYITPALVWGGLLCMVLSKCSAAR